MSKSEVRISIETATGRLRKLVLGQPDGALIGGEEDLIAAIGCSRNTIRQSARMLEREGLLKVRRGKKGGYFGTRPDVGTIEEMFATYLDLIKIDRYDAVIMASALWVEAMRKAALRSREEIESVVLPVKKTIEALTGDEPFETIRDIELGFQSDLFDLSDSAYIKAIFEINVAYSRRAYDSAPLGDDTSEHQSFTSNWREAKLLEIGALIQRDPELAAIAAKYSRKIWNRRVRNRFLATS
ncbi:MAG: GntR family transcriptional regulator [Novosphingobium sp.]|nr:GntR family transcriptional regulator [Novosphingobium sp.]